MLDKQQLETSTGGMEDSVLTDQESQLSTEQQFDLPEEQGKSIGNHQKKKDCDTTSDVIKNEELDDDTDIEDDDDGLPIDRGWAWIITLAAFHNLFIVAGYNKCMGLLFIEFLILFESSATETSLIIGVMAGMFGVSVFVTMQVLVSRFQLRYIVMMGGFLTAVGIILSVFATNLVQLILTQSVFVGMGNSMVHPPALVLIGKYFKKKRSTAAAIAASSVSAGAVVFPLLVKYLIDEYGLRGALLILGGIHLHILVMGLLMVPIDSFQTRCRVGKSEIPPRVLSLDDIIQPNKHTLLSLSEQLQNGKSQAQNGKGQLQNGKLQNGKGQLQNGKGQLQNGKGQTQNGNGQLQNGKLKNGAIQIQLTKSQESINSCDSKNKFKPNQKSHLSPLLHHRSRDGLNSSQLSVFHSQSDISAYVPNKTEFVETEIEEYETSSLKGGNPFVNFVHSLGFYLWKNPLFLLLNSTFALNSFLILFLNYYPAYVVDLGTSEQDAANFLSIAGAIDFFCRLGFGYFADLGYMKRTHICAIAQFVSALNCHLLIYYSSYYYQIIGIVLFGMFSGVYNSFIPVLIMDFLGLDALPKALGFVMITHGAVICGYHPIFGALKDYTGTFIASFHCMGACVLLSTVLLLMESLFRKCTSQDKNHVKEIVVD